MEDKILELKEQLDSELENYAVDKVDTDSGGKRRASKGILTRKIYSKIINYSIKESGLDFKLYFTKSALPNKLKKKLPYFNLSPNYQFHREFNQSGKGNAVNYDGFLIFEGEFKMLLEFKSYTEVSMLKRVFMDAEIAKKFFPDASYSLCMLESALGSFDKNDKKKANQEIAYENHKFLISYSAITLIEYLETKLDVKVDMLFLMNGIRDSKRDIGKKKYLKKIDLKELKFTVNYFTTFFKAYKKN